jgi:hypothetical protein
MLTNQTFRDVFQGRQSYGPRLKITSLTFLFTDRKGSTALRAGRRPRGVRSGVHISLLC